MAVRNAIGQTLKNEGFMPYVRGTFWHKPFDNTKEILFYPTLRWNGFLVTPMYWHKESSDPLLLCRMETHNFGVTNDKDYMKAVERLRADGWGVDIMEGAFKYIHVDELEKIEGPAPEGAF